MRRPQLSLFPSGVRLLVMLLALTACGHGPGQPTGPSSNPTDTTQRTAESDRIALYLSFELTAPESLSARIASELDAIRTAYRASVPIVDSLVFTLPFEPGCLIVGFDPETADRVLSGGYHDWDELNSRYGLTGIETDLLRDLRCVVLRFDGLLHPAPLRMAYRALPGVAYAEPNGRGGDWSNVYPRLTDSGTTYLFRLGWGDCPAGCTGNAFWYFRCHDGIPEFVGSWAPAGPVTPDWWPEARENIDLFWRQWW